jgi:hypothetical protein
MKLNISGKITQYFINSQLTVLLMAATAMMGLFALVFTPREENPQIVVPAANVMVMMPGARAQEVEELVSKRLESKLWEIPGVEDVYSVSMNSLAVVTVKFFVGQDKERSMVKLYDKMMSNMDFAPPGASQPLVKPIDVDDVPIVAVTFSPAPGAAYDDAQLRLVADHVLDELRKVPGVGTTTVIGGRSRQVRVTLDPMRIAGYGLSPLQIAQAINVSNANLMSGELEQGDRKLSLETGGFFATAADVKNAVVGVANGKPLYLGDVADITDGFEETSKLTRIAFGAGHEHKNGQGSVQARPAQAGERPAVTIALAKRQKLNAVKISDQILAKLEELKKSEVPPGIDHRGHHPALFRPRLARGGHRGAGHPAHAVHHPCHRHAVWPDDQPDHAVRAHPFPGPAGGRRHRGGGEHPPALPAGAALAASGCHPGRERDRHAHDPGDRHRGAGIHAHGLCDRHDGLLYEADTVQCARGDGHVALCCVHRDALGQLPADEG